MRPSEGRRTALKAAYFIGPGARSVYLAAASAPSKETRRDAAYHLHLQWVHDPDSVYSLMQDLSHHVTIVPLGRSARILSFLSELTITIYINHPERKDVVEHVGDLWRSILTRRLRMPIFAPILQPFLTPIVATAFSERVMRTALLDELQDPMVFFATSAAERERFARVAMLCEPDSELDRKDVEEDLVALFSSTVLLHSILAALVVAIHAISDFTTTQPLVRRMWTRLNGHGRLWLLQAFSVPLPETPREWIPLLEDLTSQLIAKGSRTFLTYDDEQLKPLDIALLPLGLAYGKRGSTMPAIAELLGSDGLSEERREETGRVIEGLASVGLWFPGPVLQLLEPISREPPSALEAHLASSLGVVRVLHLDLVDIHLREMEAPPSLKEAVIVHTVLDRARPYLSWVGIYNNAVHEALHYPLMRKELLIGGLKILAEARTPREFVRRYTPIPFRMLRDTHYDPAAWTAS